jgi:thiamine biosynthesis lipoprotein
MRSSLTWLLASAAVLPVAIPAVVHAEPFRFHYDHVLGTSLDVTAVAPDEASALMAVTAARQEIARLDLILSAWREDSELQQLNRSPSLIASPDLYAVLDHGEAWRARTGGAFDMRAGGALALWREAETTDGQPVLDKTLAASGQTLGLDRATRAVSRPQGLRLTVDGMAKGYVIDAALAAARRASPNLRGLMIDIGGDLACWGQAPQATGWQIGVAKAHDADNAAPAATLRLTGGAVASSGRGARDLKVDGCALSHTMSPATGQPVQAVQSVVVVAPKAADADALATAFMVMQPHQALALADRTPGVETLITDADGARHASQGWADLLIPASFTTSGMAAAAAPAAASKGVSLEVGYQVPKIDAEPYHAPYVVMWVTDENRQMVRTLLVLGRKPKWAPENFVWWRRYGRQAPQVLDTVARATRLPGRYDVKWDGKDEAGNPAPAGKYILHIEAAREKGGHTYQTVDLDLTGAGGAKALPAKDEMGAVDLKFGPAA